MVEFSDAGLASGSTINVTAGLNPGEIHVTNTTGVYTLSGASLNGAFDLIKTGAGAVSFSVANTNYSGNIYIDEGIMQVSADINPTTGILYLNGGTLQKTSVGDLTFSKNINFSAPSTVDTNGGNLELSGYLTSGYNLTALTKIGSGTLTVAHPTLIRRGTSMATSMSGQARFDSTQQTRRAMRPLATATSTSRMVRRSKWTVSHGDFPRPPIWTCIKAPHCWAQTVQV